MDKIFLERLHKLLPNNALEHFGKPLSFLHLRVNTLKTSLEDAYKGLKSLNVSFEIVKEYPLAVRVPVSASRQVLDSPLVASGCLYPQGLESMKAVMDLDPKPGESVLDLCAAPGSKTSQIAALMNNEGLLIANEPIRERFYRLKSVLDLTGAKAVLTMVDGRRFRGGSQGPRYNVPQYFDRVLVDAPCSSEGRFKYDDPKTYAFWSLRKIKEMSHKQKGLLLNASRLVKSDGTLVYSTCTFSPEENEEVVHWLMRKAENLKLVSQTRIWPDGMLEGFFIAKWVKSQVLIAK